MPPDAGRVQVQECKRAFYAGAESFYVAVMRDASITADPNEVTDGDMELMESLHDELMKFANDVAAGKE
jgi:hypothetical protein